MIKRRCSGFNLAEVAVVILLLTVAVLALVSSQIYVIKSKEKNEERHQASLIASSLLADLEQALGEDFTVELVYADEDVLGFAGFSDNPVNNPSAYDAPYLGRFKFTVLAVDGDTTRTRKVNLVVSWEDQDGTHDYRIWTTFYDY